MFSFFKRKKKNNTEKINKNVSVEEINQNEEVVLHPNERLSPEDLENISETQDKEEIAQKNKKDLESDEKVVLYPNERLSPEDLENISETQDKEEIAQENKKDLESDEKVVLYPNERLSPEDLENISETQDKEEIAQENKKDLESDEKVVLYPNERLSPEDLENISETQDKEEIAQENKKDLESDEKSIDTASKEEVFTIDDYINENKEFFNSEDNNSNNNTTKKSFFGNALKKTFLNIKNIIPTKMEKIPSDIIEEMLIESDMDYEVIEEILDELPKEITKEQLKEKLLELLNHKNKTINITEKPFVRLIIGVNGAGKTTTIAKLANNCIKEKETVLLGAGDTFRAAAIEQLSSWADKLNVPIIKTKQGHDSSAVAYDTISSAVAKKIDNVIIDTAGRLQTQTNLNNELKKIVKVCSKAMKNAPHQKLLILDGTQGNSAIAQAQAFNEMVGIDGIIITKLDGTAKGGAIFSISRILKLPILYIGIGETQNDLLSFNAEDFVDSILNEIYINNTKKEV